ncbi:MAG: hypothetical protein HGB00_07050 [Chlorobiaceae bacterium]|nr:hypothetical protein [Chlorobiaceae bacterium]
MQLPKNFLWVLLACIVAIVAYTIGNQGGFLKTLNIGSSGVSIQFEQLKNVPKEELEQRQSNLEKRLEGINANLKQSSNDIPKSASTSAQPQANTFSLSGKWGSNIGLSYLITQYGNAVSIQEFSPAYGITAVGEGQISGQAVTIAYKTAMNTQGIGTLRISPDATKIEAEFKDLYTGNISPVSMYR